MSQRDIEEINKACGARHLLNPVRWLLRIGFVRPWVCSEPIPIPGALNWPFGIMPRWMWGPIWKLEPVFGVFRCGDTVSDVGTWLPRRWGFRFWIFEFGQRG